MSLDQGIERIKGLAQAKRRAVGRLKDDPVGRVLLAGDLCKPAATSLHATEQAADLAMQQLKAGQPRRAQRTLLVAARALNASTAAFKMAQSQLEANGKAMIITLKVVRTIGKLAEAGLVAVGAGAAAKGAAALVRSKVGQTLAQAGVSAGLKAVYAGADTLRDQVLDPDRKVDWKKVGTQAAFGLFQNLLADSITTRLTRGMLHKAGKIDAAQLQRLQRAMAQAAGNFSGAMSKLAADTIELAQKEGLTPRQAIENTLARWSTWEELLKASVATSAASR